MEATLAEEQGPLSFLLPALAVEVRQVDLRRRLADLEALVVIWELVLGWSSIVD